MRCKTCEASPDRQCLLLIPAILEIARTRPSHRVFLDDCRHGDVSQTPEFLASATRPVPDLAADRLLLALAKSCPYRENSSSCGCGNSLCHAMRGDNPYDRKVTSMNNCKECIYVVLPARESGHR